MVDQGTAELVVAIEYGGGQTRVRLEGELDIASLGRVRRILSAILEDPARVTLDLRELRFLDIPGVRLLVEFAAAAARDEHSLELRGATGQVARVIELTRMRACLPFAA